MVVALGSNLPGAYPSSVALLEAAVAMLAARGARITARSSWWRSKSWPDASQPPYVNGIVLARPTGPPEALMTLLTEIERAFGRQPAGLRNAARSLDLDLIAFGRLHGDFGGLIIPHPRAAERAFVMGPLAEIAPQWRHPVNGLTAAELADRASVGRDAKPSPAGRAALHNRPSNAI